MMKAHDIFMMKVKLMTTQRVRRRRSLKDRGKNFDPNANVGHVIFNIANEYRNVKEFRDAFHEYIAIQGYEFRMVNCDHKRMITKCFVSRVDNSLKLTPVRPSKLSLEPWTLFASKPYECLT